MKVYEGSEAAFYIHISTDVQNICEIFNQTMPSLLSWQNVSEETTEII